MSPPARSSLPPFFYPGSNARERRALASLKREGKIREIGPRLYTSLPEEATPDAVRKSWMSIVSALFPKALLSHRTALEFKPTSDGEIFLTSATRRTLDYPGIRLSFLRGPEPLVDDPPFLRLRSSSLSRALLENLSRTRSGGVASRLSVEGIEKRLEKLLQQADGEAQLGELRQRARQIAEELQWQEAFARLDAIIGALLGTRPATTLQSPVARARAAGEPFDPSCLGRLQLLFAELRTGRLSPVKETLQEPLHVQHKAFFEAYFSNYIEGTIFEIEEAEQIVFDRKVPELRPKDAHDIMGTFLLVSDVEEMRRTPRTFEELLGLLRSRHHTMLSERPEVDPGNFKTLPNRAGTTHFVAPELVLGTLRKGLELCADLPPGLPRAIFMLFLISDVHPFVDGNGRVSRVMMNAELVAAGESTIIIPNVFRDDHLLALRALTRRGRPAPIIDALVAAQRFCALDFAVYPMILEELERRNWFRDPDEARVVR
jgi:Fic/DOC family